MLSIKLLLMASLGMFNFWSYNDVMKYATNSRALETILCQYKYIPDAHPSHEYLHPIFFLDRGGGDCDDFAYFVYNALIKYGYDCRIFVLTSTEDGARHAVCTYERGRDWGLFSNAERYHHVRLKEFMRQAGYQESEYECPEKRKYFSQ